MSQHDGNNQVAESSPGANIDKQRLGAVYAKALLGVTESKSTSESVLGELDSLVSDVLARFPDFEQALASPRILPDEKASLLDRVLGGRASDTLIDFLKVVGRHERLDCIREIRDAARAEFNRLRNRLAVTATTAQPLDETMRQSLRDRLATAFGREIDLKYATNATLLAGIVVRVGDTVYDASLANELDRLKQKTLENTINQLRDSVDRFTATS